MEIIKPNKIETNLINYGVLKDVFNGSFWGVDYNSLTERWIKFEAKYAIKFLSFDARSGSGYTIPLKVQLIGSNDWEFSSSYLIKESSSISTSNVFDFSENNKQFKYHMIKIHMLSGQASEISKLIIQGIHFYERLSLKNITTNQYYSLAEKTLIPLPDSSPKNMILHGLEAGKEIQLDEAFDKIQYVNELSTATQGTSGKIVTQKLLEPTTKILKISEVRV